MELIKKMVNREVRIFVSGAFLGIALYRIMVFPFDGIGTPLDIIAIITAHQLVEGYK